MLSNLRIKVETRIRLIATITAIFASLAVGANNTVEFFQRIQTPTNPIESSQFLETRDSKF